MLLYIMSLPLSGSFGNFIHKNMIYLCVFKCLVAPTHWQSISETNYGERGRIANLSLHYRLTWPILPNITCAVGPLYNLLLENSKLSKALAATNLFLNFIKKMVGSNFVDVAIKLALLTV